MKRTHTTITVTTIRDPGGKLILAARIAAAKSDMSMNQWLLRTIEPRHGRVGGKGDEKAQLHSSA